MGVRFSAQLLSWGALINGKWVLKFLKICNQAPLLFAAKD